MFLLEENSKPRLSTQFTIRQGWKDELPQEHKRDRLNKPFYEKGERKGGYKDGRLTIDRVQIETWDSTKTPEQQREAQHEHHKTNKILKKQREKRIIISHF